MPTIIVRGERYEVTARQQEDGTSEIRVNSKLVHVEFLDAFPADPFTLVIRAKGRVMRLKTTPIGDSPGKFAVRLNEKTVQVEFEPFEKVRETRGEVGVEEGPVVVNAPMAGRIVSLKATVGMSAEEGQPLVILEAMKMENEVASPKRGIVKEVYVQAGVLVKAGQRLALVD